MRIKDIKVGQPYFYETSTQYTSVRGDGAVYVLSTETWREGSRRSRELPFVTYPKRDPHKSKHLRTGILVIRCRWDLKDEHREILSKITLQSVVAAGMTIPEHLCEMLGLDRETMGLQIIHLDVVQPRHILGEWDEMREARERYQREAEEHKRLMKVEETERIGRWVEVVDFLDSMRPDVRSGYWVSSYGESETKEIKLGDMEELVRLAKIGKAVEDAESS